MWKVFSFDKMIITLASLLNIHNLNYKKPFLILKAF